MAALQGIFLMFSLNTCLYLEPKNRLYWSTNVLWQWCPILVSAFQAPVFTGYACPSRCTHHRLRLRMVAALARDTSKQPISGLCATGRAVAD